MKQGDRIEYLVNVGAMPPYLDQSFPAGTQGNYVEPINDPDADDWHMTMTLVDDPDPDTLIAFAFVPVHADMFKAVK